MQTDPHSHTFTCTGTRNSSWMLVACNDGTRCQMDEVEAGPLTRSCMKNSRDLHLWNYSDLIGIQMNQRVMVTDAVCRLCAHQQLSTRDINTETKGYNVK